MTVFSVTGETPTPAPNGVITTFTTARPYISGTLSIYRRGTRLLASEFTELTTTTFQLTVAPDSDEDLLLDYLTTQGEVVVSPDWFLANVVTFYSVIDPMVPIVRGDRPKILVDAVGTVLRVYAGKDMSAASSVGLRVERADGQRVFWEGYVDAENPYYMVYTIEADDLSEVGMYSISLEVVVNAITSKGTIEYFEVIDQYLNRGAFPL